MSCAEDTTRERENKINEITNGEDVPSLVHYLPLARNLLHALVVVQSASRVRRSDLHEKCAESTKENRCELGPTTGL
jgi:hypothetical protein